MIAQNERSYVCHKCKTRVCNQSGIKTLWDYDKLINFYALTCPKYGFIETFDRFNKSVHGNNEFNDKIKNLDGTNLKIFNEIKFNANFLKWETVIIYSRLLILHLANYGAKIKKENKVFKNFKESTDYLKNEKMLNPILYKLLDSIRKIGNDINHDYDYFKNKNEKK